MCMYISKYLCICLCLCVSVCVRGYVCICRYVCRYVCTYMHTWMCVRTCVCVYVCIYHISPYYLHLVSGCTNPPTIANASTDAKFVVVGHSVKYTCDSCFEMEVPIEVTCLPNKTWSEPLPQCKRMLPLYKDAYVHYVTSYWYSGHVYICIWYFMILYI